MMTKEAPEEIRRAPVLDGVHLAIVGTRVLEHPGDVERAAQAIDRIIGRLVPARIVTGGADGVDTIAEVVAALTGYSSARGTLIVIRPGAKSWLGSGGYLIRNREIVTQCTHLLRVSCSGSDTGGSIWTANEARKRGRVVMEEKACP